MLYISLFAILSMLMASMVMNSVIFTLANSPISLVISTITQTMLVCLTLKHTLQTQWFSLILFLIFVGGLMVLFIYITSLASNNMFLINKNLLIFSPLLLFTTIILLNWMSAQTPKALTLNTYSFVLNLYSQMMHLCIISVMSYLLLTLLIIVSIVTIKESPLRSITHKL